MYKINFRIFHEIHPYKEKDDHDNIRPYMFEQFKLADNPGYVRYKTPMQAGLIFDKLNSNSLLFHALRSYYGGLDKFSQIPYYSYFNEDAMYIMYPIQLLKGEPYDYTWFYHDYNQHPSRRFIFWCRNDK